MLGLHWVNSESTFRFQTCRADPRGYLDFARRSTGDVAAYMGDELSIAYEPEKKANVLAVILS